MPFREPYSLDGYRQMKVGIDKPVATQDSFGAPSTSWTSVATGVPCAIDEMSVEGERYGDQQIEGLSRFDVLMRYRSDLTEKMRLVVNNGAGAVYYDIENVINVRLQNRWLLLRCKSGANRG